MKKLITVLVLVGATLGLSACGSSGSSSSGGGGDINVDGTWRVEPFLNGPASMAGFTIRLSQNGNNVTGTILSEDPHPPGTVDCGGDFVSFTGVVAGNTMNGTSRTTLAVVQYSVTGSSNAMSGSFTVNIASGICRGTGNGTITMTRI